MWDLLVNRTQLGIESKVEMEAVQLLNSSLSLFPDVDREFMAKANVDHEILLYQIFLGIALVLAVSGLIYAICLHQKANAAQKNEPPYQKLKRVKRVQKMRLLDPSSSSVSFSKLNLELKTEAMVEDEVQKPTCSSQL
jgi:hypothetical protein